MSPACRRRAEQVLKPWLTDDHFGGRECQHGGTGLDDPRKAFDQLQDHAAADHHDRDAHDQPHNDQRQRTVRSSGDAQHVVYAHQGVGYDDGLHGAPEGLGGPPAVRALVLGGQQLIGNPQERQAAGEHQARDAQQPDHTNRHRRAHRDRTHRPPDDGAALQVAWEIAGGQRDHDRVVAGQHQVDQDDGQQCRPPAGRKEFHAKAPDRLRSNNLNRERSMEPACRQRERRRPDLIQVPGRRSGSARIARIRARPAGSMNFVLTAGRHDAAAGLLRLRCIGREYSPSRT